MPERKTVKVTISGRVQGVFYRAETKKAADRFNVNGWVRNLPDGCVEAVFEADEPAIENMLAWCRKGSPNAQVSNVAVEPCPDVNVKDMETFDIKY